MVPHGDESRVRQIGLVEIANVGGNETRGIYRVVLKKCPPFRGALKQKWRAGEIEVGREDEEVLVGEVEGFHRQKRGVYDLLWLALKSCGLERRNLATTTSGHSDD
jgi:hypothetical protein